MNGKTVLITGIKGFVGRHLANEVSALYPNAKLIGADRRADDPDGSVIVADLQSAAEADALIRETRPDFVFHLAATVFSDNWNDLLSGNLNSTLNLFESIRKFGPLARVIQVGSAAEYGRVPLEALPVLEDSELNPISQYGLIKSWQTALARYYAATFGLEIVVGRIFNLIGAGISRSLSVGAFYSQLQLIKQQRAEPVVRVRNLSFKRDFVDISDAARALILLAEKGRKGEVYNICSGHSVSLRTILEQMVSVFELSGVAFSEDPNHGSDLSDSFGNSRKILVETGWAPKLSHAQSIEMMVKNEAVAGTDRKS